MREWHILYLCAKTLSLTCCKRWIHRSERSKAARLGLILPFSQTLTQIEELKAQYMSNLVEAGFISSNNTTSRFAKGPRVRFIQLEPSLNRYSGDSGVVMACIAASMHPKLVYRDAGNIWKTLTNNAPVAIHPSSSNFVHGRRPDFGNATFLTYFNIQQSKKLYVWENGVVDEKSVLLLCGDVDVKVRVCPTEDM